MKYCCHYLISKFRTFLLVFNLSELKEQYAFAITLDYNIIYIMYNSIRTLKFLICQFWD